MRDAFQRSNAVWVEVTDAVPLQLAFRVKLTFVLIDWMIIARRSVPDPSVVRAKAPPPTVAATWNVLAAVFTT